MLPLGPDNEVIPFEPFGLLWLVTELIPDDITEELCVILQPIFELLVSVFDRQLRNLESLQISKLRQVVDESSSLLALFRERCSQLSDLFPDKLKLLVFIELFKIALDEL